jgi:hypothetical protein
LPPTLRHSWTDSRHHVLKAGQGGGGSGHPRREKTVYEELKTCFHGGKRKAGDKDGTAAIDLFNNHLNKSVIVYNTTNQSHSQ